MTQELFNCKQFVGNKITLNESESKHYSQGLRKKPGDEIILTNCTEAKPAITYILQVRVFYHILWSEFLPSYSDGGFLKRTFTRRKRGRI